MNQAARQPYTCPAALLTLHTFLGTPVHKYDGVCGLCGFAREVPIVLVLGEMGAVRELHSSSLITPVGSARPRLQSTEAVLERLTRFPL